jgi:hypothetical protein
MDTLLWPDTRRKEDKKHIGNHGAAKDSAEKRHLFVKIISLREKNARKD